MSDPHETQRSQMIGEYRLLRTLGRGSFGTVHLAEHVHEHSLVAIKILQVPLTKSEDFRHFLNEARTMRLRHQHIVPLLDFGLNHENFPYLAMEYASQGTLRDRHPKGSQVSFVTIAEYVEQIASALQYAHDRRLIHRDVKPENMLLRADGTLLLSDFGIAKIMEPSILISMQTQVGTPVYMAPEQHMGHPCFASDQYALAVVVYEWICGQRPFQGTKEWLAVQHVTAPPPSLQNWLPTLPLSIEQVILKALSKAPEQRFATVQEFATALRAEVQQATVLQADMNKLPFDESSLKTSLVQQATADVSIHIAPQPFLVQQPAEDEVTQMRRSPIPKENPLSPDQPYSPTYAPYQSPALPPSKADKASKRLSPLRRNLLLISGGVLAGFLILALVLSTMSVGHENSLNANTVSRLVKKWAFLTGDVVSSSPAVVHGVVYVGSVDHNVYAIDAQSGKQKWTFSTGDYVGPSPAVVDGIVYAGSGDYSVYAIDAQSGKQKWAFPTTGRIVSSPAAVDGVVYVGSGDHNMYAIDAQSGKQKWAFPTASEVLSSPVVAHGVVYVGSEDHNVYAIDTQSGKQKWAFPTQDGVGSSPTVIDGVVYVGSDDDNVYAIDAQSGKQKWAFPTRGSVWSSPVVVSGVLYIGSSDGNVYAIDAQSGKQKWVFSTRDKVISSPAVVDGVVYVGSEDKNVYAIDAQSGQKRWAFPTGWWVRSSPKVVNDVVYIGSDDGNVYAFGLPATTS